MSVFTVLGSFCRSGPGRTYPYVPTPKRRVALNLNGSLVVETGTTGISYMRVGKDKNDPIPSFDRNAATA